MTADQLKARAQELRELHRGLGKSLLRLVQQAVASDDFSPTARRVISETMDHLASVVAELREVREQQRPFDAEQARERRAAAAAQLASRQAVLREQLMAGRR